MADFTDGMFRGYADGTRVKLDVTSPATGHVPEMLNLDAGSAVALIHELAKALGEVTPGG